MALRNIVKGDDPILRKKSRVVTDFNERLHTLLDDMKETMEEADGVGLAAVQVGVLRRAVIVDVGEGLIELINPVVTEISDEEECTLEGCLSFPGESAYVYRPVTATVEAQDRYGNPITYTGEGLLARAFCHETDHLDGKVFHDFAVEPPAELLEKLEQEQEEREAQLAATRE